MKNFIFLSLLFIASCGHIKFDPFIKPEPQKPTVSSRSLWLGQSQEALDLHPVYATLQMTSRKTSKGIEVRTYKNSGGRFANGVCTGYRCKQNEVEIVCSHVFYIELQKISDFVRVGSCSEEEDPNFRPN